MVSVIPHKTSTSHRMGGANYMGGKRNAMKARARDEVGRKQKVFFGRQRFDMLSKGLSAPLERSTTLSIPFGVRQGPEKIALAHARGKQNEETFDKEEITTCYIPSPVRVASNKGGWRTRMRGDAHTPSSDASRSEVLDTLDLSEPMFFRETIERILATPDLAGLGTRPSESSNAEPEPLTKESSCQIPIKQKKQRRYNSERESHKVQHLDNVSRRATFSDIEPFRTPQRKEKKSADNNFGRYPRGSSPAMSPMEDISDWDSSDNFDESFQNSGYTEYDLEGDADSWIVNRGSLSSARRERTERRKSSRSSSAPLGSSVCVRPDSGRGGVEDQSSDDIPSTIGLYARHDGGTIYGKLFVDPDPWRRIGIILGLGDADNAEHTPDDRESSFDDGEQHQSMLWDEEMDLDDQGRLWEMSAVELSQFEDDVPDISSQGGHIAEENEEQDSGKLQKATRLPVDGIMHNEIAEDQNLYVLDVPELQEVDGRFIAPAIFDDLDMGWEE